MDSIRNTVKPFLKSLRLNVTNLGVRIEHIYIFFFEKRKYHHDVILALSHLRKENYF